MRSVPRSDSVVSSGNAAGSAMVTGFRVVVRGRFKLPGLMPSPIMATLASARLLRTLDMQTIVKDLVKGVLGFSGEDSVQNTQVYCAVRY